MFAIFLINIFNRSIYVLILNFFSDDYWIVRATEDLTRTALSSLLDNRKPAF